MSRVKISEFRAKTIVNNQIGNSYSGVSFESGKDSIDKIKDSLATDKKYVVKVDQGVKKRFKQGLIKLDLKGLDDISTTISELEEKGFRYFLIEEMVSHTDDEEKYLAIERTSKGNVIHYSNKGGVDVENYSKEIKTELVKDPDSIRKISEGLDLNPDILEKILEAFDINYFSFFEINPLVVTFKKPYFLDIAAEVDSAAEFFVDDWSGKDVREAKSDKTPEEESVERLSEKSQASFKLVVLNPEGSIFMLLSGGGASIVLADEVYNLGFGEKLANYGEYSGNPNEEETYIYTKNILSLLLKSSAKDKVLIIGGGVANFTDVRITFRGVIKALEEVKDKLKEQDVRIFVRRGGPHQEEGLAMMKKFLDENSIGGEVHGPDLVLTEIVSKAIE